MNGYDYLEGIGMKTFIALLLLLPVIAGCATPSQIMLDAEVKRLCAIDGGIKVYETVRLPAERFKLGYLRLLSKDMAKPEDEYYYESSMSYIEKGNPEMWQLHFKIYRRVDNKLLGEAISYARRGGDIPGPWHDSSFMCPDRADVSDLEKRIFTKID